MEAKYVSPLVDFYFSNRAIKRIAFAICHVEIQDYWLSYVRKQPVGPVVLNVSTKSTDSEDTVLYWESFWSSMGTDADSSTEEVRVYAHCTQPR